MTRGPDGRLKVIKIGGGLLSIPGALDRVCREVGLASSRHTILVVPGGGPFADAVREFDRSPGVSADAAHWMAILAMDQYALVLADRIPGAVLADEPGAVVEQLHRERVVVLAPSRWMRSADVLPHSWEVTSDSIAAFVAGALDAACLLLIKPGTELGTAVDPYFATAVPRGMPVAVLSYDRVGELSERLNSWQSAVGAGHWHRP
jgi:5-(aminomethyl)-3-furanmethanol phosphate kinase